MTSYIYASRFFVFKPDDVQSKYSLLFFKTFRCVIDKLPVEVYRFQLVFPRSISVVEEFWLREWDRSEQELSNLQECDWLRERYKELDAVDRVH